MEKLYAVCCVCGQKVGKYCPGSRHETLCPHCKAELQIAASEEALLITVLKIKQVHHAAGQPA